MSYLKSLNTIIDHDLYGVGNPCLDLGQTIGNYLYHIYKRFCDANI